MLIKGEVIAGFGEGRLIGYPTANLNLDKDSARAEPGIYAGWVNINKQIKPGILIVGVYEDAKDVWRHEVYILEWSQDIYGHKLEFEIVDKIREVIKMPDQSALLERINQDIKIAKNKLNI